MSRDLRNRKPLQSLDGKWNSAINLAYSENKENQLPLRKCHPDSGDIIKRKLDTENLVMKPTFILANHDDITSSASNSNQKVIKLMTENKTKKSDTLSVHSQIPPAIEKIKVQHKQKVHDQSATKREYTSTIPRDITYLILYGEDLMKYYLELEVKCRKFDPDFSKENISSYQRQMMVSFLIRVLSHNGYPSHISYPSVRLFVDMVRARPVPLEKLQLVALTAMWITMKKDLIIYDCPSAEQIVSLCDKSYSEQDLVTSEMEFSIALNFEYSYPDPCSILSYCIVSLGRSQLVGYGGGGVMFYYGCYMLDLALLDPELLGLSALLLGATAAEIAVALNMETEESLHTVQFMNWRSDFAMKNIDSLEIFIARNKLIRAIIQSSSNTSLNHTVFKKYKRSRYGSISFELIVKIAKLHP